ncbi:MAG: protein-L-isoaspartate(D-aspartate) O-methyltransferase [Alphaproteobacteria bacterium]
MTDSIDALIAEIEAEYGIVAERIGKDKPDPRVLAALREVPRAVFVPADRRADAYANRPLPIGFGQTISQPFIVAVMSDMLALTSDSRVLEIGTGCGYQTAFLARLAGRVYTVEIVSELSAAAAERLAALGVSNVEFRVGDGRQGWPEHAPYDAIIVTAAATGEIPPALLEQLKPGGRMVVPTGASMLAQELVLVTKDEGGRIAKRNLFPVAFVPLVKARRA